MGFILLLFQNLSEFFDPCFWDCAHVIKSSAYTKSMQIQLCFAILSDLASNFQLQICLIHIHYHYWMQYLLILWKQLEVEETCYAKHRDKVKIDSILKSSIFKHLTGWGDFPSSFRKLFNCPKEQSTGEFSPDTSSRFSLSKLNCFIHVDSSGDSPSSVHIKTAAEKIAKMTAKHILLLLLPVLQLCSFQSELCVYSLRDL